MNPVFPARFAWTLPLNNSLTVMPAFAASRGYFPLEGDRLAAYDLNAGTLSWVVPASPRFQPAVGDGLVFLVEPAGLTAVREEDGQRAWQIPLTDTLAVPLVWDTGWLIAATANGEIRAFRASDGALLWQQRLGSPAHAPPSLAAQRVYVPLSDGRLVALQLETGMQVWQRRFGGAPNQVLALDDRLYVGSNDNRFYCVRTSDGERIWRWVTGGDVVGFPLVDEQRVYFLSLDNVLRGLDRHTGAQRWKRALSLRPAYDLARAGDTVLVAGLAGTLVGFNMRDGTPAGQLAVGGEIAAAPHVVPGIPFPRVIVVARDIKGAAVSAFVRALDPDPAALGMLPNELTLSKPGTP